MTADTTSTDCNSDSDRVSDGNPDHNSGHNPDLNPDRNPGRKHDHTDTLPAITIVTPSYNQGQFIESTIQSVLSQGYPNLEYIILDACSTDNTAEILKKYQHKITRIVIEPDSGSANAINKGLAMANGEWFNWLNSDDVLMPGALFQLAMHAQRRSDKNWITGGKVNLDSQGNYVSSQAPWREDFNFLILGDALFPQDATFIRTDFLRSNQLLLDENLKNVYDTVLYLQLLRIEAPLIVSTVFSGMRWHGSQKTANHEQSRLESHHIRHHLNQLPGALPIKIARRLCNTRLAPFTRMLLFWLACVGAWPSRLNWEADVFNLSTRTFDTVQIKDCLPSR